MLHGNQHVKSMQATVPGNGILNEVDGTYEVERAQMTGGPVTQDTPIKLLEQLI
jgi:hypothetical protein